MKKYYSVAIPSRLHTILCEHLIRSDGQEDLCFATYTQSTGSDKFTGIIRNIILPDIGERYINGAAGFFPHYFLRALHIASQLNEGLVFLHSHPFPGWQGMSGPDIVAEKRIAPRAYAISNLPLIGMTLGSDRFWSARFWEKNNYRKRTYKRIWCKNVRIVGKKLLINFNDNILKPNFDSNKQLRTISAWGSKTQEDLSRLKVGIVGLGSVGSIVAEILARSGVSNFVLIDFDSIEEKNLDRTLGASKFDIGKEKVSVITKSIRKSASSPKTIIDCIKFSVCEEKGFKSALNCDIIFSCVDRPWPRQILNLIAYAHLIPVIDGGIFVRTNKSQTRLIGADWKAHVVGNERSCLECIGQYNSQQAKMEKDGLLDDPHYIFDRGIDIIKNTKENVFAFSSNLASMEVFHLLNIFLPGDFPDLGLQNYHLSIGQLNSDIKTKCNPNCYFQTIIGCGDKVNGLLF